MRRLFGISGLMAVLLLSVTGLSFGQSSGNSGSAEASSPAVVPT